jgi:hypothetical protein
MMGIYTKTAMHGMTATHTMKRPSRSGQAERRCQTPIWSMAVPVQVLHSPSTKGVVPWQVSTDEVFVWYDEGRSDLMLNSQVR